MIDYTKEDTEGLVVTNTPRPAVAKSVPQSGVVCTHSQPRVGHSLSESQQLIFDRQMLYARFGKLSAAEGARLRVIEQKLRVMQ